MSDAKQSKNSPNEPHFEQSLEQLQVLVRQLERGECSLEDSLQKFSEGMALAKKCQDKLTEAEQKIEVLLKATKDGVSTAAFEDKS
jgi:exodeoxyribonuclease VII small subunit